MSAFAARIAFVSPLFALWRAKDRVTAENAFARSVFALALIDFHRRTPLGESSVYARPMERWLSRKGGHGEPVSTALTIKVQLGGVNMPRTKGAQAILLLFQEQTMSNPGRSSDAAVTDDLGDLPEDLLENIAKNPPDEFGDETQSNEERTAEEGLEQEGFIDPRGEDEPEDDPQ